MGQVDAARRRRRVAVWVIAALALAVGAPLVVAPPVPDETVDAISVDRAMEHVEVIASGPHPMGSEAIAVVRRHLLHTLADLGLDPETQSTTAPDWFGAPGATVEVANVLARVPGEDGDRAVLLIAHHDTVPTTPGANDDAMGVAVLLEIARVLVDGQPPPTDVILLLTDGEEPTPRFGASAFVERHRWAPDVVAAVNIEGIGVAGPALLVEVSGPQRAMVPGFAASVDDPAAFSVLTRTTELIGQPMTDFDPFRDAGVPGYNLTYLQGASIYHTPADTPAAVNLRGLAHHGATVLGLVRGIDPAAIESAPPGDLVFFTIPGGVVVRYPTPVGVATAVLSALLAAAAVLARLRRGSSVREVAAGAGSALAVVLATVVGGTAAWMAITEVRPSLGLAEAYAWFATLAALGVGGWALAWRRAVSSGADVVAGTFVVWAVVALPLGLALPAIGYLFVLPLAVAALGEVVARPGGSAAHLATLAVVAVVTSVVLVPAVDTFLHFASPRPGNPGSQMPVAIAVPLLAVSLAVGLLAAWFDVPTRSEVGTAGTVGATP